MNSERTLSSEIIYRGKLLNLRVDTIELPLGKETKREIIEHQACTATVAIDSDKNVLLVRQYRKAVEKMLLEIPAGNLEPNEEPLDGARRELEEETGFSAKNWQKLCSFYTSPGFCNEEMHVYLASELFPVESTADEDEYIELVRAHISTINDLIRSGEFHDAKSIASLLLALNTIESQ